MTPKSIIEQMQTQVLKEGIPFPDLATMKLLELAIHDFYKQVAVVKTDKGLRLQETDKPTDEYVVEFTISGCHTVRAENEAVARAWVEEYCIDDYNFGSFQDVEIYDYFINRSYKSKED
jgi:hypothetical protein